MSEQHPGEGYAADYGEQESVPYVPYGSYPSPAQFVPPAAPNEGASVYAAPDMPTAPAIEGVPTAEAAPKKSRRRRWVIGGLIVVLVLLVASVASYFVLGYLNRSTPNKTLDAFCNALQRQDYHSAYGEFSPTLQEGIPEADFAAVIDQDKITICTHGNTNDSTNNVTTNLKLVHASKGVNADVVTLAKDNNSIWKITGIARQS